ncbi:MAG: hypothetical protein QOF90_2794 [Acetobacteraceae bacterium]|jgi:hypothetical protein|nr:hypothetical protein [Acetobacteraceae bacterium]MEA2777388.1 hypothetical protein [Acetobacteraceae bacterium]
MVPSGRLRAWIERYSDDKYLAAFIGVAVLPGGSVAPAERPPATHICSSSNSARQWVENEAMAFGLPVEWVEGGTD